MKPIYDKIGVNYSVTRSTDPKIAEQLYAELAGARRIVNIGAGTGSYEPEGVDLVAVEPSAEMISQRPDDAYPVKQAPAENLPFEDGMFSHAMTINSMHHWPDRAKGYSEIKRVATEKFVAITWDPESEPFWLTRDYFPEILEMDRAIFPTMEELKNNFDDVVVRPLLIPADCQDGLFAAFWKRPEAYLREDVRQATSPFSKITNVVDGLSKLTADLESGAWTKKNQELLNLSACDVGYRLVTAKLSDPSIKCVPKPKYAFTLMRKRLLG
ncbi:MAG: class I SAM-dependent methyltransferase [Chloroflexota bacterium]